MRYYNPTVTNYQSTYVPTELPWDMIAQAGAKKQGEYDQLRGQIDILNKPFNYLDQDREAALKAKQEVESQLEQMSQGDLTQNKQKIVRGIRELRDRYSQFGDIGNIQGNYDAYKAYEKHILDNTKNSNWSEDDLRTHLDQARKSFQGTVGQDGTFRKFEGKGVSDYVDTSKWLKDNLSIVADDTGISQLKKYGSLNEVTDAFRSGEINHKDAPKIINSLAKLAAGDTKLRASLKQAGMFKGAEGWDNFVKGQDKNGNIVLNTETPFGLQLAGVAEGAQYRKLKEDYMKVTDPLELYRAKKREDKEEEKANLRGMSLEGETANLLGEDTKSLVNSGILGSDGTINWKKLDDKSVFNLNSSTVGPTGAQTGEQRSLVENGMDKHKDLYKLVTKAATALGEDGLKELGINPNQISAQKGDYEKIWKAYNEYSKTRGYDVQLTPQVSKTYSDYINSGGLSNYTIQTNDEGDFKDLTKLDDASKDLLSTKNTIQVVNRRDKEGKMTLEGIIKNKEGEVAGKINLRPKAKEEINYFDKISKVQSKSLDYMTTKKLDLRGGVDNENGRKLMGESTMTQLKAARPDLFQSAYSSLGTDKPVLVDQMELPNGNTINILANPKSPAKQAYIDANGNVYPSIGDLKVAMDMEFYTTPSGAVFRPESKTKSMLSEDYVSED